MRRWRGSLLVLSFSIVAACGAAKRHDPSPRPPAGDGTGAIPATGGSSNLGGSAGAGTGGTDVADAGDGTGATSPGGSPGDASGGTGAPGAGGTGNSAGAGAQAGSGTAG